MNILMATDGTKSASAALRAACRILTAAGRKVTIVCAAPQTGDEKHRRRARARALHILERAKAMLHRHGVEAETIMQAGSPARMILRVAVDYDLLVVGGRSAEEPGRAGLGSVASRIVEHSPIPVLIARHLNVDNIEGGLRILAAVDNSQTALDGLDRLAECVDLTCADVTLLHVVETPWLPHLDSDDEWRGFDELRDEEDGGEYQGQTGPEAEIGREFERQGSYVIEQARDHLPPQAAVTTLIREGLPGAEILSAIQSGEYDLVVTGHSGSLDMKRRMLGSVAISVASNATCPVLVVGRAG